MKCHLQMPLAAAVMFSVVTMIGCQSSKPAYDDITYSNPIVDEFAASPDRTPTAQTLYAMARILVARGLDEQAQYVLSRINKEYPDFTPAYIDLAEMQMRDDEVVAAMKTLEAGLAVAPDNAVINNNLGMCYMIQEDYARAAVAFETAIQTAPRVARYRANLAAAYGMLGQYDNALEAYRFVVDEADAHYNLAVLCEARGDADRAALEYQAAEALAQ